MKEGEFIVIGENIERYSEYAGAAAAAEEKQRTRIQLDTSGSP